jgi:PAS domain S-box-containing protein
VTARKITEMALRHKTSILQCVLDSIGDGVVVADTKGKFLLFNRAAEQILKMGQTDTLPDQWQQRYGLFQPDTVTPIPKDDIPLVRAIKGENVDQAEMVVNRQDLTRPICLSANARPLRDEEGTLLGGVVVIQDITKKKRVETERRKVEESLRLRDRAVQAVSQGIIITDPRQPDNPIIYANQAFEKITGYSMTEVLGRNCRFLHGKDTDQATVSHIREQMRQKQPINVEILNYRKDGSRFWNSLSISPVIGDNGEIVNFVGVQIDVTEHKRLEEGLRQSQKMEAVGQLAGGIAHDFNNLLTVINGYSSLGLTDLPPKDPARTWLEEIHKAGERATALTQQMLVFSRKQIVIPQLLHLNAVVAESGRMLGRLISEDVMLALSLQSRHDRVNADPTQLDQVLMNLAVNARDAMPGGGRLTIETSDVELDQDYVKRYPRVTPGRHVLLAVSDTGCGMAPDVKARIFEPFFTTKGVGKGTGLGLAVVHGIIKEMGGHIEVYSEPGIGTTFKMYLPQAPDTARKTKSKSRELTPPRGAETILLVEDDSSVRTLVCIALAHQGYKVLTARNGIDGLRVAKEFAGPIHLLITDIVMPEMGGRLLWEQFAVLFPQARVLYMSGYTDDAVVRHGILHENVQFLQKPVAIGPLAFKVREVLDHAGAARVLSPLN